MSSNILITGTSSGIGYSATKYLSEKGFRVFATVRKEEDALKLKTELTNVFPIILDVTDEQSIKLAFQIIEKEVGENGLQGLVNNAGICIGQPIEYMSIDLFKEELEVNLIGAIRMTQVFLPLIRKGKGRIVNISSTNGFISIPFMGGYCATKFALEAISDALRFELFDWNIPVIVINPDKIQSSIWLKSKSRTRESFEKLPAENQKKYNIYLDKVFNAFTDMENTSLNPNVVSINIFRALTSKKPRLSYFPDFGSKFQYLMVKILNKKTFFNFTRKEISKY